MRIQRIEYENFRNFREHGVIECSTDGKVTIIYGKNGDGKTTLHQLFQWIFYGQVHFNKTTTEHLYNLQFEREREYGETFEVLGRIEFEHKGEMYSLTRVFTYRKAVGSSEKIGEDFSLQKRDDDYNWIRMNHPRETVEKLLPSGLAEYFFFDGESMIADLRVKGKDSATKLRKALYSMFDLDVIEAAIDHIGRTDLKTTVLGKLYMSKGTAASGSEISVAKGNIANAQSKKERCEEKLARAQELQEKNEESIQKISEEIGQSKSKAAYEAERKTLQSRRDMFLDNAARAQAEFGSAVVSMFPQLLISRAIEDAKRRIHLKVEDTHLPPGISKTLIHYLSAHKTTQCICGRELGDEEKNFIKSLLDLMPPKSYAYMYNEFSAQTESYKSGYDIERIESYIKAVLQNTEQASSCDKEISTLDEDEKKSPDIEQLVIDRQKAEAAVKKAEGEISDAKTQIHNLGLVLKRQMRQFDALTAASKSNQVIQAKIDVMEEVREYFVQQLENESLAYSKKLEENIQALIDQMLTSKRHVAVSPEFSVRITDSFNDESKSEGQFAVVSFAYIGGILKMLQSEDRLAGKEYPLVLDGPFSKLDPDQRQNVADVVPKFAPQVILFSKDDLNNVFGSENIGRVWTIVSNDEKNVATVEEGYLWN